MNRRVSPAEWVSNLSRALLHANTGLFLDPLNGTLQQGGANPAAQWPPHRLRGTQARGHRGVRPNIPPSIRSAARRLKRGPFA